jgi:preprotein translocase subunit SecG
MILAAAYHAILAFFFAVFGILLMGVILLQRGKGVGLSGAFGGTGGHTAFGAKTGDFLMWVTVAGAGVLLAFCIILNYIFVPTKPAAPAAAPAPVPGPTSPAPRMPGLPAGPGPSGVPVNPMGPAPMPPASPAPMPGTPSPVRPAPSPSPAPTQAPVSPAPAPAPSSPPGGRTPPAEGSPTPGPVSEAWNAWNVPGTNVSAVAPLAIFGEIA